MSYRIDLTAEVAGELRRCAAEQLGGAVAGLDGEGDRVMAVHDARKRVKKTRALLRLARPGLPGEIYGAENAALRDAGRLLSATRDADVVQQTIDGLAQRHPHRISESEVAAARARLASPGAQAQDPAAAIAEGRSALAAVAARVPDWPLQRCDHRVLLAGATAAYARGRSERRDVLDAPTVVALHDWRKRVKDLWYHERLLRDAWAPVMAALAAETKLLSELLGDDHDLAVLCGRLGATAGAPAPTLAALAQEDRGELQAHARVLGARIYAERPQDFERRLRRWLRTAR